MALRLSGYHDSVERLHLPKPLQDVDRRPTTLDAGIDGHPGTACRELDGFENRHRPSELVVLDR
jgi:hypothetical protein